MQNKNNPLRYFLVYKPYQVLSQFTPETEGQRTLADLGFAFPSDAYPIGRLDYDSEGLLLISNDKKLVDKLLNPQSEKAKTYLAQVEGEATEAKLAPFYTGLEISHNGKKYTTLPATAQVLAEVPDYLPERNPPIRYRAAIPTTWVSINLTEGKNRQVRKMCAGVGLPVLRLVRTEIANFNLSEYKLTSGEVVEVEKPKI